MANEYEASIEINTGAADAGLKAINKSVAGLDRTIKSLDGALNKMSQTISASNRVMNESTTATNASSLAASRAATAASASARARELDSRAALNQARTLAIQTRAQQNATRTSQSQANSFQVVTGAVAGYTTGANAATNANGALAGSMSNTRYLLYDIGATYRAISIALLAIPAATTAVAMSFEKDFAQVERTTGGASAATAVLKDDIKDLAESIPLAFGDLTKITALGAQLGVGTKDLQAFTEVVAKFSASTGVASEEAGAAFGRIGSAFGLAAGDYEKLGSSIAKVGVSSAATETEIIAITQQLAPLASLAGFSAQEVVGLSGALASMRIRPELARGAFQSTIFKITEATDQGGKSLQAYADIMGVTGDEVKNLFKTNPAQFFQDYITGIGKAMENGQSFSSILDGLGVKEKRERQFILAMANQYGFLGDQIKLANDSYAKGTFLDDASGPVFQTLAAQLQKLGNSMANLGDSLGGQTVKALASVVSLFAGGANALRDFVEHTPAMKEILGVLLGYGAIVGIFFAVRSAMAFVMAAMVGFQQVAGRAALTTTFSLKGIAAQAAVTRLVTKGMLAADAADYVRTAGIIQASSARVVAANGAMGASAVATGGKFKGFASMALGAVGGLPGLIIGALAVIGLGFMDAAQKAEQAGKAIASAMEQGGAEGLKATADALREIKVAIGSGIEFGNLDKDLTQIAKESGIGFDAVLSAVSKGKHGVAEFDKALDSLARSKGFKDLADMSAKNPIKFTEGGQEVAKLQFLKSKVKEIADQTDKTTSSANTAKDSVKALGGEGAAAMDDLKNGADDGSSAFDKLSKNIQDAAAEIFGLQNAEAAAEGALYKLGKSLAESRDLSIGSEGGRENIENAQQAVTKYAMALAQAQDDGKLNAQQAAAEYTAYLDSLFNELLTRGVDPAQAQAFIDNARGIMQASASASAVTVPVKTDPNQAKAAGVAAAVGVDAGVKMIDTTIIMDANTDPAQAKAAGLEAEVGRIASEPYAVGINANTDPAIENTRNMEQYLYGVTGGNYVAPVNADTSAGILNLQNFANFANSVINGIQNALRMVGIGSLGDSAPSAEVGNVKAGKAAERPAPVQASVPKAAAPAQVQIPNYAPQAKGLGSLGQGYDDVADKAKKAGDAGKKAGGDMADGIEEADAAAKDYADRLKTGLTAAFDRQYGLQKATDEYHSTLNAISKKREEELKSISDLVAKQKELNIARQGDLVDARKAQIEAEISQKYGEVDRAADYTQQAEEAQNAAAEKQNNINVALKEQQTLEDGIGKLDGYSDAAIANRAALRDLEAKTIDMIAAYAATGASIDQVRSYAANLTGQFQRDVAQMGYNAGAVNNLTGSLSRYISVINAVPLVKNTKMNADTGGATGAVNAFNAAADWASRDRESTTTWNVKGGVYKVPNFLHDGQQVYGTRNPDGSNTGQLFFNKGGSVSSTDGYASGGLIPGTPPSNSGVDNLMAKVDGKKNIRVRSGEFIEPEEAVNYYGKDYMEAIRQLKAPRYNVGGSVGGGNGSAGGRGATGPMLVELTAENIAAIQRLPQINLYADNVELAKSVSQGNTILASQGAN